jgi:hypothetical protein
MVLMGFSGAGGKLIHKKTRSIKSRDTVPLMYPFSGLYLPLDHCGLLLVLQISSWNEILGGSLVESLEFCQPVLATSSYYLCHMCVISKCFICVSIVHGFPEIYQFSRISCLINITNFCGATIQKAEKMGKIFLIMLLFQVPTQP